jgi:hypothetical protein
MIYQDTKVPKIINVKQATSPYSREESNIRDQAGNVA